MAYTKHNFKSGDILYASQLNEIEDQIALNEEGISGLSETIPEVPESADPDMYLTTDNDGNRVWEKKLGYVRRENQLIVAETVIAPGANVNVLHQLYPIEVGDIAIVTFNDVEYEVTAALFGNAVNLYIQNKFDIMLRGVGVNTTCQNLFGVSGTISITGLVKTYYTIDSKLMPFPSLGSNGFNSVNINGYSRSTADGMYATAANFGRANGDYSFAANSGYAYGSASAALNNSTVNGDGAMANGLYTIASGEAQHAEGKYNIEDTEEKYVHIIGNGTADDARSNAYTLDWEGNGWFAGKIKVGGTGQDDTTAQEVALKSDITTLTSTKISFPTTNSTPDHGTAGQFAVSDGNGGITWKTLYEAEEVSY